MAVGIQQAPRCQVAARGEQAIRLAQRLVDRRERCVVYQ